MNLSYTHRLVHLQHELDTVASSTDGLSLLHSIRRELTRLLRNLPPPLLYSLPPAPRAAVQQSLAALTAPARFPAPGQPLLTAQAQQALAVLERLARDYDLTLPSFPHYPQRPVVPASPERHARRRPQPRSRRFPAARARNVSRGC